MKRKSNFKLLAAVVVVLSLSACTKNALKNLSDDDSRIYITTYDSTVNFSNFKTYSISDSVAIIDGGKLQKKSISETDSALISAVKANMQQRGYQLVSNDSHPDLGVSVSKVISTETGVLSYPSYWGYYNSYWDPYYWGYGGYDYYFPYASYAVYEIREGALSVDIVDLKDAATNKKIDGIWNGLIRGEAIFTTTNAATQIKTLFDQSPYLTSVD
ncbi:MAG: DUF4136 domain-containing protein [Agriterribacter sp.]